MLTLALVGPYFVDWTSYRGDFEREASRILGRKVTVEGDASARILPFPSVTFHDVRVAGEGDQPALTAETFSMDAELAPFLRGELLIFDMRLERPKGTIRVAESGALDWAVRPNTPFQPGDVTIEKLTVTEGAVTIEHAASGRTHRLTEINTTVSANTLAGPWRVIGSMRLDGALTDFDASTGRVDEKGAMRVRMRAKPQRYPFSLETDGSAEVKQGSLEYDGKFRIAAFDPDNMLRGTDGETFAPGQAAGDQKQVADYRLSGAFSFDHRRLAVEEFRFETGPLDNPYTADGKADLDIGGEPRFSVTATGAQFSFDERLGEEKQGAATLESRVAALKGFVAALPKPSIPGSVELALPAVVVGDTTFREVELSAEPASGGWSVERFAVSMPGRATLEAGGLVSVDDEDVRFAGDMLLAVGQPSGFAAWLSKEVDDSIRKLPAAGFNARVRLASERQQFDDLELVLGGAKFRGRLDSLTPANAKPALLLKLDGGALDVDGLTAFASLFVSQTGQSRTEGRDLDLTVTAGPVTAIGLTAGRVDTALRLKDGLLEIDRLTMTDLAGSNISATGRISGFPANPSGSLDAALVSDDLAPLAMTVGDRFAGNRVAAAIGRRFAAMPGLGADARLNIVATIAKGEGRHVLSLGGEMGGGKVTLAYSAAGDPVAPSDVSVDFSASNEDAANLLALYGAPVLPLSGLGPGATDLTLKGSPSSGMATMLRFSGEEASARFDGTSKLTADALQLSGKAGVEAGDAAPWLTTVGVALPGMSFGLPIKLDADFSLDGGRLDLAALSGAVADVPVEGEVSAVARDGRPAVSGTIKTAFVPLDLALATVLGEGALTSVEADWPATPFPPRVNAPFDVDLDLTAAELAFGPTVIGRDATMKARLTPDGLRVTDLSALAAGGALKGLFEAKNNDGTAVASGQFALTGADLRQLPLGDALDGKADISANINGSGKSLAAIVASLSGTGTVRGQAISIADLDPAALGPIIARADAIGRDINDASIAEFAPPLAAQGRFAAGSPEVAFTIAGGILRAPPVTVAAPGAQLTATMRVDLPAWQINVDGEIAYDPGSEALVGSQPALNFVAQGPPGAMERRFDTQQLAQFLTQRALEIEQARVEAMQAALLEKQRLRREVRYYAALDQARQDAKAKAEEEAARAKAEEEAKAKADAEAQAKADEEARGKAEADAKAKAEKEAAAKRKADDDTAQAAKRKAAEEAEVARKAAAEQEAARNADAAAKAKALEEAEAERARQARQPASQNPLRNIFNAITGNSQ